MDESYVLNDDGEWVTRHERAQELARRGILYGNFEGAKSANTVIQNPKRWDQANYLAYRGFDAKRFPNTFITLLLYTHHLCDNTMCKWVSGPYPNLPTLTKESANDPKMA